MRSVLRASSRGHIQARSRRVKPSPRLSLSPCSAKADSSRRRVEFFPILQDICQKHGILFIADEVQTGFGRTGRLFACEHYGIAPDLLVQRKVAGRRHAPRGSDRPRRNYGFAEVGGLGGTFWRQSAFRAPRRWRSSRNGEGKLLSARAELLGEQFAARAPNWQHRWPIIGEIRGLGAMQALELVRSQETREPAKHETEQIMRYCYEHGLLAISAGTYGNVIRLLVPLVISDADFDEGLDVLEALRCPQSVKHTRAPRRGSLTHNSRSGRSLMSVTTKSPAQVTSLPSRW